MASVPGAGIGCLLSTGKTEEAPVWIQAPPDSWNISVDPLTKFLQLLGEELSVNNPEYPIISMLALNAAVTSEGAVLQRWSELGPSRAATRLAEIPT